MRWPMVFAMGGVLGVAAAGERADPGERAKGLPANTWTDLKPAAPGPVQLPSWETLIYVSAIKRAAVYGDYKMFSTECQHVLWAYDFEANRWEILDNSGYWGSDYLAGAGHDFSRLCAEGRLGIIPFPNISTTVYGRYAPYYDVLGRCGRAMNGPGEVPWVHDYCGVTYDPARRCLVGAVSKGPATLATYDVLARKAEPFPAPAGADKQMGYSRLMADPRRDRYYLLGTGGGLWAYDPKAKAWTDLKPEGEKPPGNSSPQAVYNERYGVVLVFAQKKAVGTLDGLYVYDPAANKWVVEEHGGQVVHKDWGGAPKPFYSSWTVYDPDHDVVFSATNWAFRYVPKDRQPLDPLPAYPEPRRMEPAKAEGAANWSAAEPLNVKPGQVAMGTSMAVGDKGVTLAWGEDQGGVGLRDFDGAAWSKPAGSSGYFPCVAVKPDGEAAVVSYQVGWSGFTFEFARRPAGGPWGAPDGSVTAKMVAQAYKDNPKLDYPPANGKVASIKDPVACFAGDDLYAATPLIHNGYLVVWKRAKDGQWSQVGTGPVTRANVGRLSLVAAGGAVHLAWDERGAGEQVLVKKWDGDKWQAVGGALNADPAARATKPCLAAAADGALHCAFIERKLAGSVQGYDQLYVRKFDGNGWQTVGAGALNAFGEKGNAWSPALAVSGTDLWVAWSECRLDREFKKEGDREVMLYDRPGVYVARWDGKSWQREGPLNADPAEGSAGYVSLAVFKGRPVVAWAEARGISAPRQVFARSRK